jgi:hypothetical protein
LCTNLVINKFGKSGASVGKVGNNVVAGGGDGVVVWSSSLLNKDLNMPGILNWKLWLNCLDYN